MARLLWLDDERDPDEVRWRSFFPISVTEVIWVQSYEEFIEWISENSLPDAICFDHDLGAVSYTHLTLPTIYSV